MRRELVQASQLLKVIIVRFVCSEIDKNETILF